MLGGEFGEHVSEFTQLASGNRNRIWCGPQADQRGPGWWWGLQTVYVFQSLLKITIYLLFVDFGERFF